MKNSKKWTLKPKKRATALLLVAATFVVPPLLLFFRNAFKRRSQTDPAKLADKTMTHP
jgi:hypothetical protein